MSSALSASFSGDVLLLSFWTVFVAEMVGDKSIYSIASLSLRFRAAVLFAAITAAFAGKMLVAVLLAKVLVRLHFWTDFLSAVAFFVSAFFLWIEEPETIQTPKAGNGSPTRATTRPTAQGRSSASSRRRCRIRLRRCCSPANSPTAP